MDRHFKPPCVEGGLHSEWLIRLWGSCRFSQRKRLNLCSTRHVFLRQRDGVHLKVDAR
jgi:hypothetical protein